MIRNDRTPKPEPRDDLLDSDDEQTLLKGLLLAGILIGTAALLTWGG